MRFLMRFDAKIVFQFGTFLLVHPKIHSEISRWLRAFWEIKDCVRYYLRIPSMSPPSPPDWSESLKIKAFSISYTSLYTSLWFKRLIFLSIAISTTLKPDKNNPACWLHWICVATDGNTPYHLIPLAYFLSPYSYNLFRFRIVMSIKLFRFVSRL